VTLLTPQPAGIPVPNAGHHSRPYWEGCARQRLLYQQCVACAHRSQAAFTVCAQCQATSPVWDESAGRGALYSWTVVWRPPNPAFRVPYAPAIVRLDEDYFMLSAVIGCAPEDLREGLRLQVEFHPASDDVWLPYFRPA
jgi:uncharacterized OB-fold protein